MELVNGVTLSTFGVVLMLVALDYLLQPNHDRHEPPIVPQNMPLVGHILGFLRNGFRYYGNLHNKFRRPVFTIVMPGSKLYVVTEPGLISRLDKYHTNISFAPIVSQFSKTICGSSQEAMEVLDYNILGQHGDGGLYNNISGAMRNTLQPGKHLDDMNKSMAREVCEKLENVQRMIKSRGTFTTVKLLEWITGVATMATTNAVYGPGNPFKIKAARDAFFNFENGMIALLISPFPRYTGKTQIANREEIVKRFDDYFTQHQFEQGSRLVQARWSCYSESNVPIADVARFEVGNAIALLVNTIPAAFWMLLTVHSVPGLLASIREELDPILVRDLAGKKITIDICTVKHECPLLLSTLKECLRYRAVGTITRKVVADTVVDGYLFKRGAIVQIPISVVHNVQDYWGPDADSFDPRRFLVNEKPNEESTRRQPFDIAYRSFGGGKHLCPGRFFATNEILAIVSLFVSRFEMRPANDAEWEMPTTFKSNAVGQVATPDYELEMDISSRPEFQDHEWNVEWKADA